MRGLVEAFLLERKLLLMEERDVRNDIPVKIGLLVVVVVACVFFASQLWAQGVLEPASPDPTIQLVSDIADLIIKVLGGLVLLFGTWASAKLPAKWQNEASNALLAAEAKLRGSLHMAAKSGVESGVQLGLSGSALITHALKHLITSVPDAIVGLTPMTKEQLANAPDIVLRNLPGPLRSVFERIIASYIPDTLGNSRPVVVAPTDPINELR